MVHAVVLDVNGSTLLLLRGAMGVASLSEKPYKAALPNKIPKWLSLVDLALLRRQRMVFGLVFGLVFAPLHPSHPQSLVLFLPCLLAFSSLESIPSFVFPLSSSMCNEKRNRQEKQSLTLTQNPKSRCIFRVIPSRNWLSGFISEF